jgi:hypothetical protein
MVCFIFNYVISAKLTQSLISRKSNVWCGGRGLCSYQLDLSFIPCEYESFYDIDLPNYAQIFT